MTATEAREQVRPGGSRWCSPRTWSPPGAMLKRPDQIAFGWAHFAYLNWAALTVRACGMRSAVLMTTGPATPSTSSIAEAMMAR